MKTLLNNLRAHIGYDDNGFLVHTDKESGKQKGQSRGWPNVETAKMAVATGLGKIEWEALDERP